MFSDELVKKFCPIFYFHSKELYFPSPWEEIIKMSTLYENDKVVVTNEQLKKNPNLIINEKDYLNNLKDRMKYRLKLTHINKKGHYNKPEIQSYITDIIRFKKHKFINIRYSLYYTYNGSLKPHIRDVETIIIRLKINNRIGNNLENYQFVDPHIINIFLNAHSGGKWFKLENFEIELSRIVIYIARESHAYYPDIKNHRRFFRLGDDDTEKSLKYDPINNIILLPTIENKYYLKYYENNLDKQNFFYKGRWEGKDMGIYDWTMGYINYFDCYHYQGGLSNVKEDKIGTLHLKILQSLILPIFIFFPFFIIFYNLKYRSIKSYSFLQFFLSLIFFGIGNIIFFIIFII